MQSRTNDTPTQTTADTVKVLSREDSIAKNITPTGRKLGVVPVPGTALVRVKYVDNKQGDLPAELNSPFTGFHYAQKAIHAYLTRFWNKSDNATKK